MASPDTITEPWLVLLPAELPRESAMLLVGGEHLGDGIPEGHPFRTRLVMPRGANTSRLARREVEGRRIDLASCMDWLASLPADPRLGPSLLAWVAATRIALGLVSRGRILPATTNEGIAVWRVGPLDAADEQSLTELATALAPVAHSEALDGRPGQPLEVADPAWCVRMFCDGVADALVRSPSAPLAAPGSPFATAERSVLHGDHTWVELASRPLTAGARPVLRLDLTESGDPEQPHAELAVAMRSISDPSLLVSAAELWDAPDAVLERLGQDAEEDLLLALRRGAASWPPVRRLLDQSAPDRIELSSGEVTDLLDVASEQLGRDGFEVLWPASLTEHRLELTAAVSTPSPASLTGAGLSFEDICDLRWRAHLDGAMLSEEELDALARAKQPLIRLRGQWIAADPELLRRLKRRNRPIRAIDALAATLTGSLEVDGETVEVAAEGPLAGLAERLDELASARDMPEPDGLAAQLRPYQRSGLAWLVGMSQLGLGGCLADDMGLGKTVQLIAAHLRLHQDSEQPWGPMLVVCPTSLLGNWERELARFAPGLPRRRHHGSDRSLDDLEHNEVVLTTYGVLRRDTTTLAGVRWGIVAADEAQHAKNPLSRTARALREVPGAARVALTGTPVENKLSELWSVLDWTTPGLLGPLERFRRTVATRVERDRDPEATERLSRLVRPFLLRRRKSDPAIVPELPPKTESDVPVPLTAEQVTLYEATAREALAAIAEEEGINRRGLVLKLMTSLKQITNHPAQFLGQKGPLKGRSAKLDALDELVDTLVAEGSSALVFTQYVAMGRLLSAHLADRGVTHEFLHGRVPVATREQMVDGFQAGETPVLLLSLKAGGTGLNLTRATHVIHYDRWWNPAVEDQATDRAYRIGQDQPVSVWRLLAEGTIEDRIASMLESKRELAEAVVGSGEAWVSELSDEELADLVRLGEGR